MPDITMHLEGKYCILRYQENSTDMLYSLLLLGLGVVAARNTQQGCFRSRVMDTPISQLMADFYMLAGGWSEC